MKIRDGPAAVTRHYQANFLLEPLIAGPLKVDSIEKARSLELGSQKTYQRGVCELAARDGAHVI